MEILSPQPHRIKNTYREFDTTIVKFESGAEQRFCNREEEVAGFKLTWYFLTVAEQNRLRDFFRARKGAFEAFTLRNHHEEIGRQNERAFVGTSASTETIGLGNHTVVTQVDLGLKKDDRIRLQKTNDELNYMEGWVTEYTNKTLRINVNEIGGSGSCSSWDIVIVKFNQPVYQAYKVRFKDDKLTFNHFNNRFAGCETEVVVCL